MKNFDDILAMSEQQIAGELEKARHEYMAVKMGVIAGQEKDSSKKVKLRQHIARLNTARRQKQLGISLAK
jgi:ribosomal protein L29